MINKEYVYTLAWGGHEGNDIHYLSCKKKYSQEEYKALITDLYVKVFGQSNLSYNFTGIELMNHSLATNDLARGFRDDEHQIDDDPKDYFPQIIRELNGLGFTLLNIQAKLCISEMEHIINLHDESAQKFLEQAIFNKYAELKKWKDLPSVRFVNQEPDEGGYGAGIKKVSENLNQKKYEDDSGFWFGKLDNENWALFDLHNRSGWDKPKTEENSINLEQAEEIFAKAKDWWIHSRKSVELVEDKNEKV